MFSNPSPKAGNSALFLPFRLRVAYVSTFQARKARRHLAGWIASVLPFADPRFAQTQREASGLYPRSCYSLLPINRHKRAGGYDGTFVTSHGGCAAVKETGTLPEGNLHLRVRKTSCVPRRNGFLGLKVLGSTALWRQFYQASSTPATCGTSRGGIFGSYPQYGDNTASSSTKMYFMRLG